MLPEPGLPIHCPLHGAGWPVAVLRLEIMPSCKSVEHMAFALADTARRMRTGVVASWHGVEVYAFPHQTTDQIARAFDVARRGFHAPERWTPGRKAEVVTDIATGLISRPDALLKYALTEDELRAWEVALSERGVEGLAVGRAGR